MGRFDQGNFNKATLDGYAVDTRDPTIDQRLLEYTLSLPTSLFASGGRPRKLALAALADRLPPAVLSERRKGLQAIDWHEGIAPMQDRFAEEMGRIAATPAAARALDIPRMQRLIAEISGADWTSDDAGDAQ